MNDAAQAMAPANAIGRATRAAVADRNAATLTTQGTSTPTTASDLNTTAELSASPGNSVAA